MLLRKNVEVKKAGTVVELYLGEGCGGAYVTSGTGCNYGKGNGGGCNSSSGNGGMCGN